MHTVVHLISAYMNISFLNPRSPGYFFFLWVAKPIIYENIMILYLEKKSRYFESSCYGTTTILYYKPLLGLCSFPKV